MPHRLPEPLVIPEPVGDLPSENPEDRRNQKESRHCSKEIHMECLWIRPVQDIPVMVSVPSKAKRRSVSEIARSGAKAAAKHPENGMKISDGRPKKGFRNPHFFKSNFSEKT